MDKYEFGKYLKEIRKNRDLTIHQVELYTGVSNSYISLLERGRRDIPSPEILKKLAPLYKVKYEDLMEMAGYINENGAVVDRDGFVNLYDLRINKNLSREELANKLNVSVNEIEGWEKGYLPLSYNNLINIYDFFGIDNEYIRNIPEKERISDFLCRTNLVYREDIYYAVIEKAKSKNISPEKLDKLIDIASILLDNK